MSFAQMRYIILLIYLIPAIIHAQFKSATIGIDGLTCSACSYGVEQSIRKLEFVAGIKTDLNNTTATIEFSTGNISMNEVVKKIYQSGFSVRFTKAVCYLDKKEITEGDTLLLNGTTYYILESKLKEVAGEVEMEFIGDHFSSKKITQSWQHKIKMAKMKNPLLSADTYFILL